MIAIYQLLTGFVQFTVVQTLAYFHTLTPSHHILTSYPHPPPPLFTPLLHTHPHSHLAGTKRFTSTCSLLWSSTTLPSASMLYVESHPAFFFFTVCRMWKSLYKWAGRVRACNSTGGQCLDKIIGVLKIEHLVTCKKLCTCMLLFLVLVVKFYPVSNFTRVHKNGQLE